MNYKIGLAQLSLKLGRPEENFSQAKAAVKEAVAAGAEIVLLPELWASGYDLENAYKYASSLAEGWFARMRELAVEHQIALGGSMIEEAGEMLFNTFLLVDQDGEQLGYYRKAHLFDLIDEKEYFTPGEKLAIVESPWGKLGLALCYDLRFPELFRAYALQGVEIILLVAEWPRRRIAHWDNLLVARAIENQCFIAAVNKVGVSKGETLGGHSAVVNPMGEILAAGNDAQGIILAEINPEEVGRVREWMPVLRDRNPAVYG